MPDIPTRASTPGSSTRNILLDSLSPDELARLMPHLVDVQLEFKQRLYEQNGEISAVYFPTEGVISLINELDDGVLVETGTIGHEGVTGVPAALYGGRSTHVVICQVAGRALRLPRSMIDAERARGNSPLLMQIHKYLNCLVAMLAQTAACNRAHETEARLARWLVMTRDRVDADDFGLTQEFLGQMLGVQRPTVNLAATALQRAGLIVYTRGRIRVVDRAGLESVACDCYAQLNRHLLALTDGREWRRGLGGAAG